jgi:hypothetical protein
MAAGPGVDDCQPHGGGVTRSSLRNIADGMSWDRYRDRLLECRIERDRPGEVCGDMALVDL